MLALKLPAPVVNVAAPQVTVNVPEQPAPVVNVAPADVTVNVPAQRAPVVNVQAPPGPAPVVNVPAEGDETMTVERDEQGRIVRIHKSKQGV